MSTCLLTNNNTHSTPTPSKQQHHHKHHHKHKQHRNTNTKHQPDQTQSDPKYALGVKRAKPEARLKYFTALCGGKRHDDRSGAPQPAYRLDSMKIIMEFPKPKDPSAADAMPEAERRQELSAERAHEILRRISDEDCRALGFDVRFVRPDWMVITNLPVPPPPVRPSVMMDSSARCEDDLTHKLIEIVRANNHLRRQLAAGTPQHLLNDFVALLQYHVTTYMDNTLPGQPPAQQKSGRPIKSISQRLKGKQGRIRGNLMGKRVDFSARTVITGDPNIGIDELGVPWSIALNLTFPETVTPFNRDKLQALVNNGPHPPPGLTGAKSVIRADGRRVNLAFVRSDADRQLEVRACVCFAGSGAVGGEARRWPAGQLLLAAARTRHNKHTLNNKHTNTTTTTQPQQPPTTTPNPTNSLATASSATSATATSCSSTASRRSTRCR